jgi:carbon starvation protein CstA
MTTTVRELWQLVVTYLKQETLEPIKGLGTFLLWGVMGAIALGIGFILVLLALLRVLQNETGDVFGGNLSWIPYLIVVVAAGGIAGIAATRIGAEKRRHPEGEES